MAFSNSHLGGLWKPLLQLLNLNFKYIPKLTRFQVQASSERSTKPLCGGQKEGQIFWEKK